MVEFTKQVVLFADRIIDKTRPMFLMAEHFIGLLESQGLDRKKKIHLPRRL